ncbi:MAG: HD domain-containing protein [Ruminococcaceae bacterium]|nr:HD domain-containing protein [Oscillospiraceae bacterium]
MDTKRNSEFLEEIKKRLSEYRFYHSLNVADEAKRLALKYGADPDKAYTAGLVHDIMKDTDKAVQRQIMESHGHTLTPTELVSPKTWHAVSGALFLKYELGVSDEEILSAVRYHTTARAGMSLLEKVLYVADFTSKERDYDDVDIMREKADRNLDEAMLYGLQYTICEMVKEGRAVHEDSLSAYNEVAISEKERQRKGNK